MATPNQVNGSNNGLLGKRKKSKRSKGSYLSKWLDKTMQHIQEATPSMDTYEPFLNMNSNWQSSQFAPGYEPCRYNMYGCAEPMSLPTLPTYYNPAMPPFYNREYRYQPVNKSVQVQRPRPRRRNDQKVEEVNTTPTSTLNYLQPKNFTDSQDYASLPPIVTSVGDTNSNSDLHTNDKDDCSNTRRFSDPCVRGLPDVARPNGDVESDSESNSSASGSQIGSRLLGHLLDQIASLKMANDRLNKELYETRAELENIRQHNAILQKGPNSSIGATPNRHLNDNGSTGGQYSPGFLADLVREIRDAARVREEALYSRVRAMVIERTDICEGKLPQDLCTNTPTRKKRAYSATDVSPSMYDSPIKKRLCRRIIEMKHTLSKKTKTLRKQRDHNRNLKRKIASSQLLLQELEKKNLITEDNKNILTHISPQCAELLKRQVQKKKTGKIVKKQYSPLLRSFALTLNFYSTKAYNYVRKKFNTCLPHIKTLGKWYRTIDGKPGFTEEAFQALKIKSEQASGPVYCCLVFDEIKIERKIEKNFGYVDFGASIDCDGVEECTDALVYLVVPLYGQWKVPIGYFMIKSITADQKMFLLTQAIRMCREVNIIIKAVTFDGCPANISMAKKLKCDMNPDNLKTVFNVDGSNIAIFLDPAHMIKLVRNAMEHYKEMHDSVGNVIQWNHIKMLHELQETEKFHAANKLRAEHLFFKKNIMKVKLASQLFSRSVSVALKLCKNELGLQKFKNIDGTARMLMIINNVFDILDSKVHGKGLKRALNKENAGDIILKLKEYKLYINNLTTILNGKTVRLVDSPRFTGFLGLCVCIDSLLFLYNDLVESNRCPYLSLHRISQDHIELLFCNIRSHGGANNNPTPKQFYGIYRKLLVHSELQQVNTGNCIELEKISILNCSSAVKRINVTTERGNDTFKSEDPIDESFIQALQEISLSQFSDSIIEYIAGAVVHYLIKSIKCNTCVKALVFVGEKRSSLIFAKDFGGLLYPSDTVTKICKRCELVIRVALKTNTQLYYKDKSRFVSQTLSTFINENLFPDIHDHQFDHENCNHVIELSRSIMDKYIDIRLLYLLRKSNAQNAVRRVYTKLIHFKNQ